MVYTSKPSTIFNFGVVLVVTWLDVTFVLNNLIALKKVTIQASDIAKTLSNDFVILYTDIARAEDFRKRYLFLFKIVDNMCYLRPTDA